MPAQQPHLVQVTQLHLAQVEAQQPAIIQAEALQQVTTQVEVHHEAQQL